MSAKNKKQFGVWLDSRQATIIGSNDAEPVEFVVLGHASNEGAGSNSNENAANNLERKLQGQFFNEILTFMQNVDEVHVTGTGTSQEQFIRFMEETPQYRNVVAKETTSNKMSDDQLVKYISGQFN
jgi:stalled ribosome rescue protein Dom34